MLPLLIYRLHVGSTLVRLAAQVVVAASLAALPRLISTQALSMGYACAAASAKFAELVNVKSHAAPLMTPCEVHAVHVAGDTARATAAGKL